MTVIPRTSWFGGSSFQASFPANAAALDASISASPDFDALADPSHSITPDMYWDGTHLDPLLKPVTAFGANGAAYRNHSLWIVNSDQGSIVQIPINGDGSAGKPRTFVKSAVLGYPDDDNFDACGNLWVGDIGNGNLVRISPEGVPEIMITAAQFNGFFWPTNPVFGFRDLRSTVYITGANPSVVKVDLGVPGMIPPQFDR